MTESPITQKPLGSSAVRLPPSRAGSVRLKMAKMLEHPAPKGSRSVSWPWYHHCLTNELTPEARIMLEFYSRIPAANVESHIYSIVSIGVYSTAVIKDKA